MNQSQRIPHRLSSERDATPSPARNARQRGYLASKVVAVAMLASLTLIGCDGGASARRDRQSRRHAHHATELTVVDVIDTFNHLHDFISLELEPPIAILDNGKTFDGQPAMATFGSNHASADASLFNYLTITSRNVRLKSLNPQPEPGDQVHYFVLFDEREYDPFLDDLNMANLQAAEMTVAQVVDDEHIITQESGRMPLTDAFEIQIWRNVDDRVQEINKRLGDYAAHATPALDWQPSPDEVAIEQAVNRLNQWMRHSHEPGPIQPLALLDSLPEAIRQSPRLKPHISPEALAQISFAKEEGRLIQETVWLRNISNWARGKAVTDVDIATALFDWTVRHLQLEVADTPETAHHLARSPWQILLHGTGTAQQRAWIFVHLCRQQSLQAVLLGIPGAEGTAAAPQFWCAAVESEGRLYLFDPALGLPIPGPDGKGVATLTDAAENPGVLRQLDLEEQRYPWTHEDAGQVVAYVVASPLSLSRRAALLQRQLVGPTGFVLAMDPAPLAASLADHGHIQRAALWPWPFEVLDRRLAMAIRQGGNSERNLRQRLYAARDFSTFALEPHLWKARALHFRGPTVQAESLRDDGQRPDSAATDGHKLAIGLYQEARAADRELTAELSDEKRQLMSRAKSDATYWLGLLKIDQGDYEIAITSWLPQVITAEPQSPWRSGARYNLARAYEALGNRDEAIKLYEQDESPQQHGNRLRAEWLREGSQLTPDALQPD